MSFPLWNVTFLIVMPCLSKKPFEIPRSSGSPFAIGNVSIVTVTLSFVRPAALPANSASTMTAADSAATSVRPRRFPPSVLIDAICGEPSLCSFRPHCCGRRDYPCAARAGLDRCLTRRNTVLRFGMSGSQRFLRGEVSRGRPLAFDQPVDVCAETGELGELLRRDLVARRREVDRDQLLHLGRRVGQDGDAVGEVDGLVDVVCDEEDRHAVLLAHAEDEILQVAARLRLVAQR